MTWDDEARRIRLEHRLEQQRILLKGLLTFISLVVIAVATNWLGVNYASSLRREELTTQSRVELLKHEQSLYLTKRFEIISLADSLCSDLLIIVSRGAINIESHPYDTSTWPIRRKELMSKLLEVSYFSARYRSFLDSSHYTQFLGLQEVYRAMNYAPPQAWDKYAPFIVDVTMNMSRNSLREYDFKSDFTHAPRETKQYVLRDYLLFPPMPDDGTGGCKTYLDSCYNDWVLFRKSIGTPLDKSKAQ